MLQQECVERNMQEWYSIFSVAYKLIVGFAAVGIINGVFMQLDFGGCTSCVVGFGEVFRTVQMHFVLKPSGAHTPGLDPNCPNRE